MFAEKFELPIYVIESREHIGGNSFSYIDKNTGIDVHKYGSHIFHTNNEKVWSFVNRFSEFQRYEHKVFVSVQDNIYSFPINLLTLSQVFGKHMSPMDAKKYFDSLDSKKNNLNFEDKAVSTIGRDLYEKFFKGYTKKQWGTDPKNLPEEIFNRIPIRLNFQNSYFSDKYQGVPVGTYGDLANNIADHPRIHLQLNRKWSVDEMVEDSFYLYSGPIDELFDYQFGRLSWRGVKFEIEQVNIEDFQGNSVINYPEENVPFTRIHEFKHFKPKNHSDHTIISREYPVLPNEKNNDPAYPVRSSKDLEIYHLYEKKAEEQVNLACVGRLGTYRYLDMHMAIGAALTTFEELCA